MLYSVPKCKYTPIITQAQLATRLETRLETLLDVDVETLKSTLLNMEDNKLVKVTIVHVVAKSVPQSMAKSQEYDLVKGDLKTVISVAESIRNWWRRNYRYLKIVNGNLIQRQLMQSIANLTKFTIKTHVLNCSNREI